MNKVKWYHYVWAITVMVIAPFLVGVVIAIVMSILHIFTPSYYRPGQSEINIIAGMLAIWFSTEWANDILKKEHPVVILVVCVIHAVIWSIMLTLYLIFGYGLVAALTAISKLGLYVYFSVEYSRKTKDLEYERAKKEMQEK